MKSVPGTEGYRCSAQRFIEISQALNFAEVCEDFLPFLPKTPSQVLDAGSGAGQNAAALAEMGHLVTAVEPVIEFLTAAQAHYSKHNILWIDDSLPKLEGLKVTQTRFHFILIDAVWHHLNPAERITAMHRLAGLLSAGGRCALSLRNGPAGLGTRVYPTNARETIHLAAKNGLNCLLHKEHQPSILPGKEHVKWSRIVFEKC